jgi:membrane protein implicated in regulation of membrane protease activity
MNESVLYILIAVFALLTVILVWFGAKAMLDIRKRKEAMKQRQQSFRADKQRNRYEQ